MKILGEELDKKFVQGFVTGALFVSIFWLIVLCVCFVTHVVEFMR
jgi:hypothetical protein